MNSKVIIIVALVGLAAVYSCSAAPDETTMATENLAAEPSIKDDSSSEDEDRWGYGGGNHHGGGGHHHGGGHHGGGWGRYGGHHHHQHGHGGWGYQLVSPDVGYIVEVVQDN